MAQALCVDSLACRYTAFLKAGFHSSGAGNRYSGRPAAVYRTGRSYCRRQQRHSLDTGKCHMNIAVTGANGLVGGHLVEALTCANHRVLAISRSSRPAILQKIVKSHGWSYAAIDICDESALRRVLIQHRIEVLIQCAVVRWRGEDALHPRRGVHWKVNVDGAASAARAAAAAGVRAFIHSSAMMVFDLDGNYDRAVTEDDPVAPAEPNGLSVVVAEQMAGYLARRAGMPFTILRYPGIYGPGKTGGFVARCIEHVKQQPDRPLKVRSNRRADFLWVGDAVAANVLVLEALEDAAGHLFHIGSESTVSTRTVAQTVCTCAKRSVELPEDEQPLADRRFGLDCSKATRILGYKPHSLSFGISQTISDWFSTP
ncbi:MAG: NAD-dependent epimerase/dehydratase family protein [Chitinivibrionales bacterium]|nr:NAD-dependent epimerase/dehydratase family protein [Chitinivibrionales bacterium]